ncbi:chitin-binding lectin 1-like [Clupea harengus]|uniref:Chitin-binding lectin 1-like n=1 Tax=Clupea harengus TaxID=7950 RepID=A0A8M1KAL3_CLUHA|nr:chitin-binding lectin 1-like [Clupea harengus]
MYEEEDPLLSHPSVLPLEGVGLGPFGGSGGSDRGLHLRGDTPMDERGLGFHLPPYPSDFSYSGQSYQEEYCSKPEGPEESIGGGGGRGALSERQPSFESLELGFTELLPPLYPRGIPQPPSPSPWLDSPYLSSSPSPSHSSSLSPFPASSPISTSPLPPLPHSPYPSCPYPQEVCPCPCPSPPTNPGTLQDLYPPPPYSQYEGWEPQGRAVGDRGTVRGMKMPEGHLEFASSPSMHHITLEEVTEFIGEDIRSFQSSQHMDSRPG